MSKIEGIERLEGRGITAKVTDDGKQFTTYDTFAKEVGYEDAAHYKKGCAKARDLLERIDETFAVLAKGKHEHQHYGYVYVIESDDDERFLVSEHGLEITYPTTQDSARLDRMDYGELIEYADEVSRAVRRKAYAEGYEQGKYDALMDEAYASEAKVVGGERVETRVPDRCETLQEIRDRIVAQAKVDVEGLKNAMGGYTRRRGYRAPFIICDAEFIVNTEKRTVVCLLKEQVLNKSVKSKGFAKCAPDDCFNAHIGKVIALYRALGKDVPSEYLRVPNPTEVRVGNIVRGANGGDHFYHREKTFTITQTAEGHDTYGYAEDGSDWLNKGDVGKIVDDSESRTQ